jgi:hypothetical protein
MEKENRDGEELLDKIPELAIFERKGWPEAA